MHGNFLRLLETALDMVPYRSLYSATIFPDYTAPNRGFQYVDFSFRITNKFITQLDLREGDFQIPRIYPNHYVYELYAIPFSGANRIISVEEAMKEIMLARLEGMIDPMINRAMNEYLLWFFGKDIAQHLAPELDYLIDKEVHEELLEFVDRYFDENWKPNYLGPFSSITLKKPFEAGVMEPYYYFKLPFLDEEIRVGAHSGEVRYT